MIHYTYIIYSKYKDSYYIGVTKNLNSRLKKHNHRHKGYTGSQSDWILRYSEQYSSKSEAIKREKQLKSWKSRNKIETLIRNN